MSGQEHLTAEARRLHLEAVELRRAAAADLAAAASERSHSERARRDTADLERAIARREAKLKDLGEVDWLKREAEANAKLDEAKALLSKYDRDKHQALLALTARAA